MPSSSAFIELIVHAIYSPLCKNEKKSLNVSNVELLSNLFFNVLGEFFVIFSFGAIIKINTYPFAGYLLCSA
jgi:hypothetical protein